MSDSLWPRGLQQAWLPCPSPSPRVCSNSCPLGQWYHLILCREDRSEIWGLKTTEAQYFKEVEYKIFTLNSLNFRLFKKRLRKSYLQFILVSAMWWHWGECSVKLLHFTVWRKKNPSLKRSCYGYPMFAFISNNYVSHSGISH